MSEPDGFMLSLVWVAPVSFGSAGQPPDMFRRFWVAPDSSLEISSGDSGWCCMASRRIWVVLTRNDIWEAYGQHWVVPDGLFPVLSY